MTDAPKRFTELLDWEEDDRPTQAETYAALRRSITRTAGFGLKLLECTPSIATETIAQLREDLPDKTIAVLALEEAIEKLFERVVECIQPQVPDVLFIVGLEKSLVDDISPGGFGGEGDYYREDRTPRILAHLNQNREKFRDAFDFCLVLVLPRFAHKYFVRQAKDFVDWGAGVFELKLDQELIEQEALRASERVDFKEYEQMTAAERREKRIELQTWIEESDDDEQRSQLLCELGRVLNFSQAFEEALASFDRAIEIKPDDHQAWSSRGTSLKNLGQYEAAVASCDRALEIKPDFHEAWYNRGLVLYDLGQYEAAVASYGRALEIKPDFHGALSDLASSLRQLGQKEAAMAICDRLLEVEPDTAQDWNARAVAFYNLGEHDMALANYDRALELNPNFHLAWYNKVFSYVRQNDPDRALFALQRAIELAPMYREWAKNDTDFDPIRQDPRFQTLINPNQP
jgi:tetratricopeptide (TPR) repeat protein